MASRWWRSASTRSRTAGRWPRNISDADRAFAKTFGLHDPGNDIAWPAVFVLDTKGSVAWRSFEENDKERVSNESIVTAATAVAG